MLGVLLVNLGTPDDPSTGAVRRYLREFLGDPRVLDMNPLGRFLLLELVILPWRPRHSAEAYRAVWDAERGSPLLYHSQDLAAAVAAELGLEWRVALAMRYGRPSIAAALDELEAAGVTRIVVVPLYPQYASSTTGSTAARVFELAAQRPAVPQLVVAPDFYADPGYVAAVAAVARPRLEEAGADHVLFSMHGLPERHLAATDLDPTAGGRCLKDPGCCDRIDAGNRRCYRAQCYASARAIAAALGLADGAWSVAFQSRLGRVPWIRPYTDETLAALARERGVRRVAVLCPSFVSDCLETLEEIGRGGEEQFVEAGGEALTLVPCLNSGPCAAQGLPG